MIQKITEQQLLDLILFGLNYDKNVLWKSARGRRRISCGNYPYEIFNICFLHDMLSQILQTLYEGYIPYIDLKDRKTGWCNWDTYFKQPYDDIPSVQALPLEDTQNRIQTWWGPTYTTHLYDLTYELTCKLYQDWIIIKDPVFNYIAQEYKNLIHGKRVLGVLCRGTDFTLLQPKGHPVQPPIDTVINDTKKKCIELNCDYIYVASEEQRIVNRFQEAFPGKIVTNQRHYYDEQYYNLCRESDNAVWIPSVFEENEESNDIRGLEYLSSIVLLSSCIGLIAGNCGGSEAALYINNHQYEYFKLYNLGMYS